ncbi:MAG: hypothetical protein ABIJ97_14785 [Bacteroidota bacterium]
MRKTIILTLILFTSIAANTQENRLSIGIGGSFDKHINYYTQNPWVGFDHQFADITEFSLGTQITYQINN